MSSLAKLGYIDMMRGCAILMVIAVHTAQQFSRISPLTHFIAHYGQMGVQLFFVASAYTLCHSWARRKNESNQLVKFYLRRLFRIAPLYYLAILMYLLIHLGMQVLKDSPDIEFHQYTIKNIASNILFIHGFYPPANDNIVPGGWSVGTEMAFYLIFPVLFSIFERANLRGQGLLLWGLVVLSIIPNLLYLAILSASPESAGLTILGNSFNNSFAYHHLFNQLPVFLIGMLAFYQHQRINQQRSPHYRHLHILYFLIFTAISLALAWMDSGLILFFLIIPISSGISFYFLMNIFRCMSKPNKLLSKIGQASYSMYVFHFIFWWYLPQYVAPLIVKIASKLFPGEFAENLAFLCSFILISLISYVVATISQKWIEARGIALGNLIIARL